MKRILSLLSLAAMCGVLFASAPASAGSWTTVGAPPSGLTFSIILGEPENYNLPPAPEVPTAYLKSAWTSALLSAAILALIVGAVFAQH